MHGCSEYEIEGTLLVPDLQRKEVGRDFKMYQVLNDAS